MIRMLDILSAWARRVEAMATDAVAKVAPWAAPIPTAYLVGRATIIHLQWPAWVGIVTAVIVESLGLATAATALELREYNQAKRKSDPAAPFALAATLVAIYLVVALGLTVALDIVPTLAVYAPAVFPLLSLTGVTVLALRGDHRRRLETIETDRQERQAKRQARRQGSYQETNTGASSGSSNNGKSDATLDVLKAGRKAKRDARLDALLSFYRDNPDAGPSDAARAVGVSRQTIYTYNAELEATGRLRKNGDRWEVLT
jgi:hypothetical protein